jgi:ABC-type multidrug transport system fused ATPase/permease subunit
MSVTYIAIGLLAVSVIGITVLLVYLRLLKHKYKKNSALFAKDNLVVKNKSSFKDIFDRLYQMVYMTFVKMPVIKYYTKKTRLKLEMTNDYTEYEIRKRTGKYMLIAVIFIFVSLFVLLNLVNDLYMSLIVIVGVLIIAEKMIDLGITSVSNKILRQMPDTFTAIRHAFHEHGMIDEAFNTAIDEMGDKEIGPQLKKIKEAIISDNPEVELEKYYDTAPNRFLKLFAGISYLTYDLGDRKVDGTSVYLKNLNNILQDIYLEILKQDKINYMFRSLNIIAVVPLICIKPLQAWAESNFPALSNFYNSSFGFIMQSLIIISIFVSYLMLRIVKEDSEQIKFDRVASVKWQDKLYKITIVKLVVDAFKSRPHTKKNRKETMLIKNTNSYLTIEWLYVNKITAAFVTFILALILMFNVTRIDVKATYNKISDEFLSFGQLTEQQEQAAQAINDRDKTYIDKYKNKNVTKEQLEMEFADPVTGKADADEVTRVYDKIQSVKNSYIKFWQVLTSFVLAFIAYYVPSIILFIRNKIREMEKENEIMQFQSIILMLMYIDRIDVQTILEWLCRFSYAFKEPIATCLNNYESGAYEALEDLKEDVPYKDFQRIIEQLQSAVERIPIRDAFDELETERAFFHERRKEGNERLIKKKTAIGKVLGFTPMVLLIGGYLVAPLMIVSIMQMMNYFTKMSF